MTNQAPTPGRGYRFPLIKLRSRVQARAQPRDGRHRLAPLALGLLLVALLPLASAAASPPFLDVTADSGLDFVHFNGMSGEMYFPEMMGPAIALIDYDGDGDLDVYAAQGGLLAGDIAAGDTYFPPGPTGASDRLYRNDWTAGDGSLTFTDVTPEAGLADWGYAIGAATGDYDNDGRTDLYLANYGPNALLRNVEGRSFAHVTAETNTEDPRWSSAAAFVDYDRDGWLDLFVVNYVDFQVTQNPKCFATSSRRDYCGPASFAPQADRLLHNRGDGTFEDVSAASGIGAKVGPGLGVVVTDANRDGWPDLYVANDGVANFLWLNQGDGTFREDALLAGAAVNAQGRGEAGMGVDAEDFDNDGDEDIFLTHLLAETNTLYVNDGDGNYNDRSNASGLGAPSLPFTGFGAGWVDFDNDGWLDVVVTNGAEKVQEALAREGDRFPLDQPNQLYRNRGDGTFEEVPAGDGSPFALAETSRAAAFGDLDQDGDTDLVIGNTAGPARLLLNNVGSKSRWLGLRLIDPSGRDALGARVEVVRDGAPSLWRRAAPDGSFAAAGDPRALVGLGEKGDAAVKAVHVLWPDGSSEIFPAPAERRYTTLRQGSAKTAADAEPQADVAPQGESKPTRHDPARDEATSPSPTPSDPPT